MKLYTVEDRNGTRDIRFSFHRGQRRVWRTKARFPLMLAGSQSGKTTFGPWWLAREIRRTADLEGGDNDYLALTTTYRLFSLKMLPALQEVFCDVLKIGRYWPGAQVLELCAPDGKFWAKRASDRMWGRVILLSVGSTGGIVAATARAAWMDEVGQDEWDVNDKRDIDLRLALHRGRGLGTTTPYNSGWIKNEWYDRWVDGDPEYEVIQFPSTANPAFPEEEFENARRRLPDWRFNMYYLGQFARPSGLILSAFTDEMVVSEFAIAKDWGRVCGTDFGGANTANLWLAHDKSGSGPMGVPDSWYVYDEFLGGGVSTANHAERLQEHDDGLDVEYWGGAGSEVQERLDYAHEGIPMQEPPVGSVEVGISRMIELIQTGRLFVFRKCKGLRHEIETYRRKLDEAGEPTEIIVDKRKFHRIDALRGAANGIFGELKPPKKKAVVRARG